MITDVINLGSSSKGNAYFLNAKRDGYSGENFGILIECGFTFTEIAKRLRALSEGRFTINDVKVVLITHRHLDHSKALLEMLDMNKRVYAPQQAYDEFGIDISKYKHNAFVSEHGVIRAIADKIIVRPLAVVHDEITNYNASQKRKGIEIIDDREKESVVNLAYIITINNNYNILFMIDTMYNPYNLSKFKFDMIFMEANYIHTPIAMAFNQAEKDNDYANIVRYKRLLYAHLSVETATKTLNGFDLSETQSIFITHLSTSDKFLGDELEVLYAN